MYACKTGRSVHVRCGGGKRARASVERSQVYRSVRYRFVRNRSVRNRSVRNLRQRLQEWRKYLTDIQESLSVELAVSPAVPVDAFLDLTLKNIMGTLSGFRELTSSLTARGPEQQACHSLECPRLDTLTKALGKTVDVLKGSTGAFKSRQLRQLRRHLTSCLNGEAPSQEQTAAGGANWHAHCS